MQCNLFRCLPGALGDRPPSEPAKVHGQRTDDAPRGQGAFLNSQDRKCWNQARVTLVPGRLAPGRAARSGPPGLPLGHWVTSSQLLGPPACAHLQSGVTTPSPRPRCRTLCGEPCQPWAPSRPSVGAVGRVASVSTSSLVLGPQIRPGQPHLPVWGSSRVR